MSPIIVLDTAGNVLYGHKLDQSLIQAGLSPDDLEEDDRVFSGLCPSCVLVP